MNAQPIQIPGSSAVPQGTTPIAPRKGWFARNWKWFVPALLIVFLGLPLAILGSVFAAIRSSDAATESLLRAQSNPLLVHELGAPIEEGWLVGGSINVSGTSGDADLAVPISGSKAKGKIYVTAHKAAGVWSYSVMEAAIDGSNQRINLLSDVTAKGEVQPPTQGPAVQAPQETPPVETQTIPPASQPADQPTSFPSTAPPAAEQAGVIQTQETNEEGVTGELIECRRSGGVLNIKVRFRNRDTSDKPAQVTFTHWNDGNDNPKFYVTAGNKKYFMLTDADGTVLSSNSTGNGVTANLDPGKTYLWWAKYPAPPAEITKINLMMPVTPPFEDVPITDK
ncbi:MAG: cytochrome c oxidase assembly factor Coa1 family protein [Terriglobales bacterium]